MDARELTRICRSFRAGLRGLQIQAGLARAAVVALVLLPPVLALDWWIHLESWWRLGALLGWIAALGATAWWTLVQPLKRAWSDREILRYLDANAPDGSGMLLDLLELSEGKNIQELDRAEGKALADEALRELAHIPAQIRMAQVFVRGRVMRWLGACAVLLVLFGVGAAAAGTYFTIGITRFFNPFSRERWPHRTTILVKDIPEEGTQVPQMEPFTVNAEVSGDMPPQVTLSYRSGSTGFTIKEKVSVGADGKVSYTFPEVREPLEFKISGGDYVTDTFAIGVVERPFITKILADYTFPTYAGIPNKSTEGGQLSGLEGTKVKLSFQVSVALEKALFVPNGGAPIPLDKVAEKTYEREVMLKDGDTGYAIELYDTHGYREPKPERYEIRVIPDNLPEVEMLAPGEDIVGTRTVGLDVAFRARDDFGLQKVEFLYSLDSGQPQALTDRVTGPIVQQGRSSESRFEWDMRKIEGLPDAGTISYFVRVQDINPTGRGKSETTRFQVKILKPTDFHLEVFEAAKGIMAEGLIAWRNQLDAWKKGQEWLKSGSGKEDDPIWVAMKEKQETATRAVSTMESHIKTLTRQYEKNHMEQEFMAARVSQIAGMITKISAQEMAPISASIRTANPKTAADAAEGKAKTVRNAALTEAAPHQRMSLLMLDRLIRKVFDWRDLQTAAISTSSLLDRQEEVTNITAIIAPKTIGKELEDLQSEEQVKLETLGKQQRALFDAETQLEQQLSQQMYRARLQKRDNIRVPLEAAFSALRSSRVNDNLKESSKRIEDNQPSAVVAKQKAAVQVLRAVKGGLMLAGQNPDPETPIKADLAVNEDPKFEEVETAKKEDKPAETPENPAQESEVKTTEDLLKPLQAGSDPLSTLISQALEKQDDVLSRSRYLSSKTGTLMPRFLKLRNNLLLERQDTALALIEKAMEEASKLPTPAIPQQLGEIKTAFQQSRTLLQAGNWGEHVQQMQSDSIGSLNDLIQFIAFRRSMDDHMAENKRQNGVDAFQRQYLLRDKDLDLAADVLRATQEALLDETGSARHAKRLAQFASDKNEAVAAIEKVNRAHAAERLNAADARLKPTASLAGQLSKDAATAMSEGGFDSMKDLNLSGAASELTAGAKDGDTATRLEETRKTLANALQGMRDQMEERVKPKEEAAPAAPAEPVTQESFEKARSPETLAEKIKANPSVPPAIKEKMLEVLKSELPAKYKALLLEYYGSFSAEGDQK